jgi:ABC-type sulfate/molybdate transport systems ATPase subunit
VALVGPSGAGKTTVLRAIAGAVRPAEGRISLGERVLLDRARRIDLPPEARRVGYVFQEYALFPHMTVRRNVAFGGAERADELLGRLGIAHLAGARPPEISGGERQRVALARALAAAPQVLLLDEPLSALDAHTRDRVRGELRALLRELGLPALLVTHDFEDAAALADRVGVVVAGRVLQAGRPRELIDAPADAFVASFVGSNLLPGVARPLGDGTSEVTLEAGGRVRATGSADGPVGAVVHPWQIELAPAGADPRGRNRIEATLASLTPAGGRLRARVGPLLVEADPVRVAELGLSEGRVAAALFATAATRMVPGGQVVRERREPPTTSR